MRADHPYLLGELTEIKDKMAREKDVLKQATWKTGWVKLFTSKSNLARLAMALNIQLFGQLSGLYESSSEYKEHMLTPLHRTLYVLQAAVP